MAGPTDSNTIVVAKSARSGSTPRTILRNRTSGNKHSTASAGFRRRGSPARDAAPAIRRQKRSTGVAIGATTARGIGRSARTKGRGTGRNVIPRPVKRRNIIARKEIRVPDRDLQWNARCTCDAL
jgi:hypothetical protein